MTDEERRVFDALLQHSLQMHYRFAALVEYLIDHKAIKEKDDEVWKELDLRAEQLQKEDRDQVYIVERARELREAWSKLPKQ